jgi:gliding motility-associated-like protein
VVGLKKISVYVRPLGNCLPDTSVAYIWVMELESVFLPTSFTPNGDGLNDIFIPMVNTIGIKNYDLTIVNRWGQIVFKSNNPQMGWDGTNSMGQSLEGVFTCMLELQKEKWV